jgi:hypothetical protein
MRLVCLGRAMAKRIELFWELGTSVSGFVRYEASPVDLVGGVGGTRGVRRRERECG